MSEEDFIKVWSESSRESILHQFYWERKELREIIDKAIEYVENNSLYEQDYDYDYEENLIEYPPNDEKATKELLDILRGEDKE